MFWLYNINVCVSVCILNQAGIKTVPRPFLCIVNMYSELTLQSASHSDWAKMVWGLDGWETRGATCIEQGFSLATSLWVESVCLGLCAPMSVSECVSLVRYERKKHSHVEMCAAIACSCLWLYATHMEEQGTVAREDRKREMGEFQVTSKKKKIWQRVSFYEKKCVCSIDWGISSCSKEEAKHFLPDGCETLLRPSNRSWQQHLYLHWFSFLLYLEKHGSHARRRHCKKVGLPLFINSITEMQRKTRREFGNRPNLENKMPRAKINRKHHHDT